METELRSICRNKIQVAQIPDELKIWFDTACPHLFDESAVKETISSMLADGSEGEPK